MVLEFDFWIKFGVDDHKREYKNYRRNYNKVEEGKLREFFRGQTWNVQRDIQNPTAQYLLFQNIYNEGVNKYVSSIKQNIG